MAEYDYDVVVIGSGPAGEGAAMNAAKHGKKVAIIEEQQAVGGNCTHKGTIPSKALRHSVKQIVEFNTNPMFREIGEPRWFSFQKVLDRAEKVMSNQVMLRTNFYARNRVDVFFGKAEFKDANTLLVKGTIKGDETLRTKNVVIATGSSPYCPSDIDFTHPRIYNSDTILKLNHTPRTIVIFGAGVIGCEYASIFSGLGVKVDLIDTRGRLLSFLDGEISDALSYHLRNSAVKIRHNEDYSSVTGDERGITLCLQSGKKIRADAFLWCNGRSGNTAELKLENAGLAANNRGQLEIDERYRTAVDGISAVGDVIGWPSLASAAIDQGRATAADIIGTDDFRYIDEVPTGIYTIPEISSLGKTEEELTAECIPYEVGQAFFKDTARAQITSQPVGMLKILFDPESLKILGLHCFGDQASEIIHIGQAIMGQKGEGNTLAYFVNTTFNYPTMAEAYRVAAIAGLNRIQHL
jgi:NAD(P) transhydrogenase